MKIKDGFMLSNIADNYVIIPTGNNVVNFNSMITLNETGAFLWEQLNKNITETELVDTLLSEYEVDVESAKIDVSEFIEKLKSIDILEYV